MIQSLWPADIARQEMDDQHNPYVRARRLARYLSKTAGKVWQQSPNGEWIMVTTEPDTLTVSQF